MLSKPNRCPYVLQWLLCSLLLIVSFAAQAVADRYQQGWQAYEQGDFEQAFHLWLPLAEQGHVTTQINVGVMYDYGQGVTQDYVRAAEWYRAAARQGNAIAQYNLGLFLAEGKIEVTAGEDALYWLQQAADQGYADAQLQLGLLYARGAAGQAQRANASELLYRAGLSYLTAGDGDGAVSAVTALRQIDSDSELAMELDARMVGNSGLNEGDIAGGQSVSTSTGTAWVVSGGIAVTNHHVIAGKSNIVLMDQDGSRIPATVVAQDAEHDIALLSVGQAKLPAGLRLASGRARLGTSVFTIGFPRVDTLGKTPKLSLGVISSVNGLGDDPTSYQISVPIQPGNSGGPLVNMRGEVVGLITTMLGTVSDAGGEPQPLPNINYALKSDYVLALLRDVPGAASVAESRGSRAVNDLEALADQVQRSVLIVMAE